MGKRRRLGLQHQRPNICDHDDNRTLTAVFEGIIHPTLTLIANPTTGGGVTVAELPPYTVGQTVHVTATPTTDNVLSGWLKDGLPTNGKDATITVVLDVSHVITANFSAVVVGGFPWWSLVVLIPATIAFTY